ncbi:MAG: DUF2800 domain-containing protein [Lachnospiraceae bacterium]|nr:DUF2800 domain-containing protein [Candidatus Minthocola equi]
MIFNEHLDLMGKHAFLAPSNPAWLSYDESRLIERYQNRHAQEMGTILHGLACDLIKEKITLAKADKKLLSVELQRSGISRSTFDVDFLYPNFMSYVNDAIGFRMEPEVLLKYSNNCFGTADTIKYTPGFLRIHDYKSGTTPAHIEQLMIYAALFCLEYKDQLNLDLGNMKFELRLYQYDLSKVANPTPNDIRDIADIIVKEDNIIKKCQI